MIVGYMRVSTENQSLDRQSEIMKKYNVEKLFYEKKSGKNTDREELQKMLEFVRSGDTLVVESYSRLARSTKDLMNIVDKLNSKGVNLISDKENTDTSTASGKLIFTVFSGIAEFERNCLLERQREGIAAAKNAGVKFGRKRIEVDEKKFEDVYRDWKKGKYTGVESMKKINLKKDTFYRRVREYEENNKLRQ